MNSFVNLVLRVCLLALLIINCIFGRHNPATSLDVFLAATLVLGILETDKLKNLP